MFVFLKKYLLVIILSFLFVINIISLLFFPDLLFQLKKNLFSLSIGQSYFSRISLINYFALSGDWNYVEKLSQNTDPVDTTFVLSTLRPDILKKRLNQLTYISNKTANDYVQIAKIYLQLGEPTMSLENLNLARQTDPIREDLQILYYQFQKQLN